MAYDEALKFTLGEEGGYVDDPRDKGGATNRGVTQGVYDAWREAKARPSQDVRLMEYAEVEDLYRERYWEPGHCGELPARLGVVHFDWCVNHGVKGALLTLQQTLGVTPDGAWGPKTAAAAASSPPAAGMRYDMLRGQWYLKRVAEAPDQAAFLPGWLARVVRLDRYVEGLR
jgi:lysozyme family protein